MPVVKIVKDFRGNRRNMSTGEILDVSGDMASSWIRQGLAENYSGHEESQDKMRRPAETQDVKPKIPEDKKSIDIQVPKTEKKDQEQG